MSDAYKDNNLETVFRLNNNLKAFMRDQMNGSGNKCLINLFPITDQKL